MKYKILNTITTATLISSSIIIMNSAKVIANEANARGITVTIEAPNIQNSQLPNPDEYYVIDFDDLSGIDGFSKTNEGTTYSYSNDLEVKSANQWGGANGSKFITQAKLQSIRSYSISVSEDQKYFGFWWSAGDPYNVITFKNDGEDIASFKTADLVNFIDSSGIVETSAYMGNPVYSGDDTGHLNEPFSFVNVFFNDDSAYDEIVVATMTEGGSAFESDNHTFSAVQQDVRGEVIPNAAPIANDDTATVSIFGSLTIDVLANDTDADGDTITITSIDSVSGGTAEIQDNKIDYSAGSVIGEYILDYTIQDEYGKTDSATVIISVTAMPD
jgi:hypothetical protein